jgi:predicted DNA-binding transcriptional regulator AlpA
MTDYDPNWTEKLRESLRNKLGLITEHDLSVMLDLPVTRVISWRSTGRGPRYVKLGNSVYYTLSDIGEWIARNTHSTSREQPDDISIEACAS